MSVHAYFKITKEIVQNIKTQARQNAVYSQSWPAISAFIEEDALAAFIAGLRKPYFGYAQAARPRDVEEAYAFFCKFSVNELISNNARKMLNTVQNTQNKFNNVQKPQKPKEFSSINHNFNKPSYSVKGTPTPMEVDPSLRSRNSFNKRVINSHEFSERTEEVKDNLNDEFSEENDQESSGNFQEDLSSDTES